MNSQIILNKRSLLLTLIILLILLISINLLEKKELNNFAHKFTTATNAANVESMIKLYEVSELSIKNRKVLETILGFELGMPIKSIAFQKVSRKDKLNPAFHFQKILKGYQITPKYIMVVKYNNDQFLESNFLIGKNKNNQWKIYTSI